MNDINDRPTFETIKLTQLQFNPFDLIQNRGMLLTAGDREHANSMMINWGMMGVVWNRNVVEVLVRPQRHTHGLLAKQSSFSLSLFDRSQKEQMLYFGTHSGKDEDKYAATGFHLDYFEDIPYIAESKFVLFCRKFYVDEFNPEGYLEPLVPAEHYAKKDFHIRYIGEIQLVKQRVDS